MPNEPNLVYPTNHVKKHDLKKIRFFGRRRTFLNAAFTLVFFLLIFSIGFPKPMIDDLFFIGAGINLYEHGFLSNPLIARQCFPSLYYFVHPPFQSYFIAGWISVFGLSTQSFLLMQAIIYIILSFATISLLNYYNTNSLIRWTIPLGVTSAFISIGLRPESLSACMTMLGYVLIVLPNKQKIKLLHTYLGFLIIFVGGATASRLMFFSGAMSLAALIILYKKFKYKGIRLIISGLFLAAMGSVFLLFSVMIKFNYSEFIATYLYHANARVGGDVFINFRNFIRGIYGISHFPQIMLFFVFIFFLIILLIKNSIKKHSNLFRKNTDIYIPVFLIFITIIVSFLTSTLGHGVLWYIFLGTLIAGQGLIQNCNSIFLKSLVVFLIFGTVFISNSKFIFNIIGLANSNITLKSVVEKIGSPPPNDLNILVDSWSARHYFDYRIPQDARDWSFSARFPKMIVISDKLNENDLYILGPESLDIVEKKLGVPFKLKKWSPFNKEQWSFFAEPKSVYIIPANYFIQNEIYSQLKSK